MVVSGWDREASPRRSGRATGYAARVHPPDDATTDTWVGLAAAELPVRDHAVDDGGVERTGVQHLTYEAYESQAEERFHAIVAEVRTRWPDTGRVALLHRVGRLVVGESSVVAVVGAPHRAEAFEAARYAIDALKASAPIWKHEVWDDGRGGTIEAWGTGAHEIVDPADVPSVRSV
jgi:molybdopterin synthase catalytic subunit